MVVAFWSPCGQSARSVFGATTWSGRRGRYCADSAVEPIGSWALTLTRA
ncbi:uncharacterized protein METZ01_LOCUS382241 [marine metagenome]|uniref:Uncharacterized protein n=1 Tax=marine metagenome TaxID=408172 RepID=A0A382U609_9ZZZZ